MSTITKEIIKNLLKNNTCETCKRKDTCMFWYSKTGEDVRWQLIQCPEEETCEYYKE